MRNYTAEAKRRWALKSRYGLRPQQIDELLAVQGGVCAVCEGPMRRMCVDHCHETGIVRGLVCHQCNIRLGGWDDPVWRAKAEKYLELVR